MISFDGQVAIVTGAGRGIGRDTALGLARRGARVVVNDYGGGGDTLTPGTIDVAQTVVDEIKAAGGEAIAEDSSIGTGAAADAVVGLAIKTFGRVDVLVNNAGGSLGQPRIDEDSDEQAEGVIRTNLIGPYMLVRRVWSIMKGQKYGRIVNVMSGAMMGMVGTAAYSAGKSGLIGLTNTAAVEGAEYGILTNGAWPIGLTRLANKLEDPKIFAWMQQFPSSLVAEGIIYLCSPSLLANGEMFTIGGGRIARNAVYAAKGFHSPELTAEMLVDHFEAARDMSQTNLLSATADVNGGYE